MLYDIITWFALLGGVWLLFVIPEEALPDTTKKSISDWLKNVRLPAGMEQWPTWFTEAFDHVFGKRHFSIRCFVRSCVASSVCSFILLLIWISYREDVSLSISSLSGVFPPYTPLAALWMFALLNWLPDYLSLLETRHVLQWMKRANSWKDMLRLLVIDFFLTSLIWIASLVIYITYLFGSLQHVSSIPALIRFFIVPFLDIGADEDPQTLTVMGVFFYSTYFTSIWIWLFLLSGWIIKCIFFSGKWVRFLLRFFDIDNKPLRSMGVISCVLITIVFWTWVIAVK